MDKVTAFAYLHGVILERFLPGPDQERWLAWLTEFSHAEETLRTLSQRFSPTCIKLAHPSAGRSVQPCNRCGQITADNSSR
jgi:hypothetical protein